MKHKKSIILTLLAITLFSTSLTFNKINKINRVNAQTQEKTKAFPNIGTLIRIEVKDPGKTEYIEGETINYATVQIIAVGTESSKPLANEQLTFNPAIGTTLSTNNTQVQITYNNKSTTYPITVYSKITNQNPTDIEGWLYYFNANNDFTQRPTNNIKIDFIADTINEYRYQTFKDITITNTYAITHPTSSAGVYLYSDSTQHRGRLMYITKFNSYYQYDPTTKNQIITWLNQKGTFVKKITNPNDISTLNNQQWTFKPEYSLQSVTPFFNFETQINFTSNNENFTKLKWTGTLSYYNNETEKVIWNYYGFNHWTDDNTLINTENYKTITIQNFDTVITDEVERFFTILNLQIMGQFTLNYTPENTPITPPTEENPNPPGTNTGQEVIDLPGLMLQILAMPWYFISNAFDVTLFENTNYEINFSNIFKGMIAILALLFIVKLFTNGFNAIGNVANNTENRKNTKADTKLKKAKTEKIKNSNKESKK